MGYVIHNCCWYFGQPVALSPLYKASYVTLCVLVNNKPCVQYIVLTFVDWINGLRDS